jgi:copper homeostasis protein
MAQVLVEAAVDTFADAVAAQAEGCQRIELCGPLHQGGTTPSAGLIARCCEKLLLSVQVLVRPRAGDFVYSEDEIAIMCKDIAVAKELGADGVVVGALTADGHVDAAAMAELISVASPMRVGFHRAFDKIVDQDDALELLVSLQCDHILTSGGAKTAAEGSARLASLVERAHDRIAIVAGGSITPENVVDLLQRARVPIVHGRTYRGMVAAVSAAG